MHRRRLFSLLVITCGLATQARGADDVIYPASSDPADVTAWLMKETDLSPANIVGISPGAVTGILNSISVPGSSYRRRIVLRSEAITEDRRLKDNALSWTTSLDVDCETRLLQLGRTMFYSNRNLFGDGRAAPAASAEWLSPAPGGPAYNAVLRVCGPAAAPSPSTTAGTAALPGDEAQPSLNALQVTEKAPARTVRREVASNAHRPEGTAPGARSTPPTAAGAPKSYAVQIIAANTEADARATLASVAPNPADTPTGIATTVTSAVVGGKTVYRALLTGFVSVEAATAYCHQLMAGGQACFVRPWRGG